MPIGYGQTISQPYIVGLMTEPLDADPGDRVLEIGTGLGYQAAILAELTLEVYTIEILAACASGDGGAARVGYTRVHTRDANGCLGWDAPRPSTPSSSPPRRTTCRRPRGNSWKAGGRMVIPIGQRRERPDALAFRDKGRRADCRRPGRSRLRAAHRREEDEIGRPWNNNKVNRKTPPDQRGNSPR